jgi:GntR family transcriptional regulator
MHHTPLASGAMPKYRQLLHILRKQIVSGDLNPGEQLPTEEYLSEKYSLSRGTVRRALGQLEAENLIHIEHGVGSFVRGAHPNSIPFHFAFESDFPWTNDENYQYTVLAQEIIEAPADISERLRLSPTAPIFHIARLKLKEGKPISYSERYLPTSLAPDLMSADLSTGVIHNLLIAGTPLPLLKAEIEIEAHFLNEEEASRLNVNPGERAVVIRRLTYTAPNHPAVWYQAYYLASYTFQVIVDENNNF